MGHQSEVDRGRLGRNDVNLLLSLHGVRVVELDDGGAHQGLRIHRQLDSDALMETRVNPIAWIREQNDLSSTTDLELKHSALNVACNHHLVFVSGVEQKSIRRRRPERQHQVKTGRVIG